MPDQKQLNCYLSELQKSEDKVMLLTEQLRESQQEIRKMKDSRSTLDSKDKLKLKNQISSLENELISLKSKFEEAERVRKFVLAL